MPVTQCTLDAVSYTHLDVYKRQTEDYYDVDMNPEAEPTIPEWKVYFDGDFWGHSDVYKRQRIDRPIERKDGQ